MRAAVKAGAGFFLWVLLLSGQGRADETSKVLNRIYAHLAIQDPISAIEEAQSALNGSPENRAIWQALLRAEAHLDQDQALFETWRQYRALYPDAQEEHRLHEVLAWAIIEKANRSTFPLMRIQAMLAAYFSQDAKGTAILAKNMSDRNLLIRAAAVEIASHLRDVKLQEIIYGILVHEKNWKLRLLAISAVGKMGIKPARKELMAILSSPHARDEEKAAAAESLVNLTQTVHTKQIEQLVRSERAALRALACKMVLHTQTTQVCVLLLPLLKDSASEVRAAALQTFGILKVNISGDTSVVEAALKLSEDSDPLVAISAAWYLTLFHRKEGLPIFHRMLQAAHTDTRNLAAAALSATGKHGIGLMRAAFTLTQDPFVRLNLAMGLIGQREETEAAGAFLAERLQQDQQRWEWAEQGIFKILKVNTSGFDPNQEITPEVVNQLMRLELIGLLAIIQHPGALDAVKSFLKERSWGISGMASALLLTEGDEEALELVKCLLQDPDPRIRIQAACILAIWGRGEEVIDMLQKAYSTVDRPMKERILESLGRIGSSVSIPFFLECLEDSSPSLRVIAAAGLLQCLYH